MDNINKYYKEIKQLTPIFSQMYFFDKHTNQTIINDALLGFLTMLDRGSSTGPIDPDNYKKYKPMMFICLKNEVNKAYNSKNYNKNKMITQSLEYELIYNNLNIKEIPIKNQDKLSFNQMIEGLDPKEKAFIRFIYKRGWDARYAAAQIWGYLDTNRPHRTNKALLKRIRTSLEV